MWDNKEGRVLKNWCFQTVVLEKTLESPLDSKEIQPVHPKGNQPWIFIARTDAEASILWPPNVKSWLIWKAPDAGKDWGQEEKGVTEDEMVGWYHQLEGHEFEQTLGDSRVQGSLACCSPWGCRVRHDLATEQQHCSFLFFSPFKMQFVFGGVCREHAFWSVAPCCTFYKTVPTWEVCGSPSIVSRLTGKSG